MNLLQSLFTVLLLNLCCTKLHLCTPVEEAATACFGLTWSGIKSHFSQKSCLSYHEHEIIGLRVVLGADNMITYDAFVGLHESNRDRTMNLKAAEVLFNPVRRRESHINSLFIGFDMNGTTLVKLPGDDKYVTAESSPIFDLVAKSTTQQKSYIVLKSRSILSYSLHQIDLIKEKVILMIRYDDGIRNATGKTDPMLVFGNMSKSLIHEPSAFSDAFITAALLTLIIVALLMTISTIVYTLTSINEEKGKKDGGGKGKNHA